MDVRQMACDALAEEERPEREAKEREMAYLKRKEKQAAKSLRKRDMDALAKSPIVEWFPGVMFEPKDHDANTTIYESEGSSACTICLAINKADGTVHWAEEGWIEEAHARRRHGWRYTLVQSAADVGREVKRHDDIMASMPAHLP